MTKEERIVLAKELDDVMSVLVGCKENRVIEDDETGKTYRLSAIGKLAHVIAELNQ